MYRLVLGENRSLEVGLVTPLFLEICFVSPEPVVDSSLTSFLSPAGLPAALREVLAGAVAVILYEV